MSVHFGRWSFGALPPPPDFFEKVNSVLTPWGTDGCSSYHQDGVSVLYRAFHTTKESRRETQPYISPSGAVITWDGRLDNRAELIYQLSSRISIDSPDVSIVAAAYDQRGTSCFEKLIGDWTLSIWNPNDRSLILAKDPIGTRHLYYSVANDQIVWSTTLDPLVLFAGRALALNEEYIAGWFSFFPATHLTPYLGIESVSPSCFVRLERGRRTISKYWDFDPHRKIRYHTGVEYEEHFRTAFAEAVRRRLRSDTPVLAELSGGMDSSSIVCMADDILAQGAAETPRLDTLSYFNDSEPNWNERPNFTKVEERRGRPGYHIDIGTEEVFEFESDFPPFSAIPGTPNNRPSEVTRQFAACLTSQGTRIVLSGIGGDEFTGGVPTPVPELMDSLAGLRIVELAKQLRSWALQKRLPWFHLLLEAARGFFPTAIVGVPKLLLPAPWISQRLVQRHWAASTGYPSRVRFWGPDPSFQENILTLESLRRQLGCSAGCAVPPHEKRFPFLDRDFLEFMFAVPRGQIVRPGQRRSLMRRALAGIVPAEILNRKRKAFVARSPLLEISADWVGLTESSSRMMSVSAEIIDANAFRQAIESVHRGQQVQMVALLRTLGMESWMKGLGIPQQMGGEPSDHRAQICDLPRAERNHVTRHPIELS